LQVNRIAEQAPLFASTAAVNQVSSIAELVQSVANKTDAFDPPLNDENKVRSAIKLIEDLPDKLRRKRKPLMLEARRHLGIDSGSLLSRLSSISGQKRKSPFKARRS
jgi:hypothetical protein